MADKVQDKTHISVCIAGHVDAGKSTTTGRLIFELGGINQREMDKLQAEADAVGKGSFAFAFYMDRQKEEQQRGVTISVTTKEFFTETKHYTILDCPGHRDFIKNMLTGSSQADVAVLMVPADGNFTTALAKGDHKKNEVQGQTRQHALLLNLLGVKQLVVCINKMDCDSAKYSEARYTECRDEAMNMLQKVGWKKDFLTKRSAFLPISGFKGDNLVKPSENMPWWKGVDLDMNGEKVHVHTLVDFLDKAVMPPERNADGLMRVPISGVYNIKGVGDVLTGRVEQGTVNTGDEVVFLPRHTEGNPCTGKVFSIEMHHRTEPNAPAGKNVGMNIKGLNKNYKPKVGDVMVRKADKSLGVCQSFTAQVQIMNHPGKLASGYTPIAFVRTGRSACRMTRVHWKMGKETGGKKMENTAEPDSKEDKAFTIQANEVAEVTFVPQQPFVVDTFKNCEGLGRVAIMEGNGVVMLGKVIRTEFKA